MQDEKIPLIDCPVDYFFGEASGKLLNQYGRFPCKIQCAVYAFMVEGTALATVNITRYEFRKGDLIYVQPGSFFLVHEFSEDAKIVYIVYSSKFVEKHSYNMRRILPSHSFHPMVCLNEEHSNVILNFYKLMEQASNTTPSMLSSEQMVYVYQLIHQTCTERLLSENGAAIAQDRKMEIYHEFNDLVLHHYREWHHVAEYAEALHITVPHLCSTIKQASGRTAGEIIVDAILMDAKAQLKISNVAIKEIANDLGFDDVALFNRYFKSHVGVTPKMYRNG